MIILDDNKNVWVTSDTHYNHKSDIYNKVKL